MTKINEKEKAIKLRKSGLSYSEVLKEIPVAKSTLSLWLKEVGLNKGQKQRLTQKKLDAAYRGAMTRKNQRLVVTKEIIEKASKEIGKISKRELWLLGIMLYWAEGSKQKKNFVSQGVTLGNSDPNIIKIFLKWLYEILNLTSNDINIALYIHKTGDEERAKRYWSRITNIPSFKFQKTIFKKHNIKTNRKFDNNTYYGLLRITVKGSTKINRKISGWIKGICENI